MSTTTTLEDKKKKLEAQIEALERAAEEQANKDREKAEKDAEKKAAKEALQKELDNQPLVFDRDDHQTCAANLLQVVKGNSEAELVFTENALWKYENEIGSYVSIKQFGDNSLATTIDKFSGMLINDTSSRKEIRIDRADYEGIIKVVEYKKLNDKFFSDESLSVSFLNGYLSLADKKITLVPHSPEYKCRFYMPFDYDPSADCPKFQAFLESIFKNDFDKNEKIMFIRQFFAACILGYATKLEICTIFYGEQGRNGKSTLLKIFQMIVPSAFTTSLGPAEWSNRFSPSMLVNKRLNSVSELPDYKGIKSDRFKEVISGDAIKVEDKGKTPYITKLRAGHVFASNHLPEVSDINDAFWRRWRVISFNETFKGEDQKKNIPETMKDEIPGIINWCLQAFEECLQTHSYINVPSSDDLLGQWKEDTNSIIRFLNEKCEVCDLNDKSVWSDQDDLYEQYKDYCKKTNAKPFTDRNFAKSIRKEHNLDSKDAKHAGKSKLPYTMKLYVFEDRSVPFSKVVPPEPLPVFKAPPISTISKEQREAELRALGIPTIVINKELAK
jgi:P4 family phage/plasmid primase-like protien